MSPLQTVVDNLIHTYPAVFPPPNLAGKRVALVKGTDDRWDVFRIDDPDEQVNLAEFFGRSIVFGIALATFAYPDREMMNEGWDRDDAMKMYISILPSQTIDRLEQMILEAGTTGDLYLPKK